MTTFAFTGAYAELRAVPASQCWRIPEGVSVEVAAAALITFGTASTESVLPAMMRKLERAGCQKSVVGMVMPAGYTFNPDGLPLFPDWVIATTYFTLDDLYYNYYIDDYQYLVYLGMADALFYSCVVEHFQNQGGWYADPRINVGELSHPLNGSSFINDPRVQSKLTPLLWVIQ